MNYYAMPGASDEWYTPKYIFDALGCRFDFDPCSPRPPAQTFVPTASWGYDSLGDFWDPADFIWLNPPFGGRNGLVPWLDKFFEHGNGVALTPDRTSAPWWQDAARRSNAVLFIAGKVRFIRPDGTEGKSPGDGTTLFAVGDRGIDALENAAINGLGTLMRPVKVVHAE